MTPHGYILVLVFIICFRTEQHAVAPTSPPSQPVSDCSYTYYIRGDAHKVIFSLAERQPRGCVPLWESCSLMQLVATGYTYTPDNQQVQGNKEVPRTRKTNSIVPATDAAQASANHEAMGLVLVAGVSNRGRWRKTYSIVPATDAATSAG